ncbi:MAG TPA: hypothetical protein VMU95_22640 [Trebonia sp.]|nr:hypothetical protein [Trebonia sp.]
MSIWSLDQYSPEGRRAIGLDVAAGVIALALLLLVAVDFSAPLRLVLALLFTFYVPGRTIVTNWPRMERWSGVGMSIVFSLGVLTLLATLCLWAGLWHPLTLFLAESLASLLGLAFSLARRRQAGGAGAATPGQPMAAGRTETDRTETLPVAPASGRGREARGREAPPWRRVDNGPSEPASWPPAQDRQSESSSWGAPERRQPDASTWETPEVRRPEFRPRPMAEDPQSQAQAPAPAPAPAPAAFSADDRRPSFQPRVTAEETHSPAPFPAEDRRPTFQPWPSAGEPKAETPPPPPAPDRQPTFQPWSPAQEPEAETPPWPRAEAPLAPVPPTPPVEEPPGEAPPWPRADKRADGWPADGWQAENWPAES